MDTVVYSFLIPIIGDVMSIASHSVNLKETSILIAKRLIASGVIIIGVRALSSVIYKIIRRLES